ncbi:MAG: hypothetical protein SOX64_03640 [Treponema sp.]|nr:hypothetical protein [Spirochaetia bacterium]MDY4210495.1 hypothetical protein [Treponema sp.]
MKFKKIPQYIKNIISGETKIRLDIQHKSKELAESIFEMSPSSKGKENSSPYSKLVAIDGIAGFAGSSAITDFLAEFSECTVYGGVDMRENPDRGEENNYEVDFFRDAYGVLELEKICYFDNDRIINTAIKDFEHDAMYRYKTGMKFYGDFYLTETQNFISEITDFYFKGNDDKTVYFAKKMSVKQYRAIAKKYLTSILKQIPSEKFLVLDNLASIVVPDSKTLTDYFGSYKILASRRDPRDLYTAARHLPGNDWVPRKPEEFVKWYKWYAERYLSVNNKDLLLIRFEDFVLNYDKVSKEITKFIGLPLTKQIKKNAFFNPDISKNNIGIYKTYEDQNAIEYIAKNLKKYLYTKA